jgi:hypothetical protein
LTLPQSASSIPINAKMCTFPAVRNARLIRTKKSAANAPSRTRRKVGWSDEPGVRMVSKKDDSDKSTSSLLAIISRCSRSRLTENSLSLYHVRLPRAPAFWTKLSISLLFLVRFHRTMPPHGVHTQILEINTEKISMAPAQG